MNLKGDLAAITKTTENGEKIVITLSDDIENPKLPVPVAEEKKEFRRPNRFVPLRVNSGGTLTLLSRKLLNVIIYHTQRLSEPGQNAPPSEEGENINANFYWVPLTVFTADANYNSDDVSCLRDALDNLQSIKLHKDTANRISSSVLIADYQIVNPLNKRGSRVMVGWELPSAVKEAAKNPDIYAWADVRHLNLLQTTAGIALFEIVKRYAGNESGLTMRESVEFWFDALTGVPVGTKPPEYKYFKRDTIKEAMIEVNSLTNLQVELLEFKVGRRVAELQFKVSIRKQVQLELPPPPIINTQLVQRIIELGINSREAEKIFATTEESLLRATLAYVEERQGTIDTPAAYFRTALRDKYATGKPGSRKGVKSIAAPEPARAESDPNPEPVDQARNRAMSAFESLSLPDQKSLLERFSETLQEPMRSTYTTKGLGSAMIRRSLASWLVREGRPAP